MPRRKRQISKSSVYHIVQRGDDRQTLFEGVGDKTFYLGLVERFLGEEDAEVKLLAWCIMPNHVHLLVRADIQDLSRFMKRLGVAYARYYNELHDRRGPLFQDRFLSEAIRDDAQLRTVVRYIHGCPLNVKSRNFEGCRWTSYREFVGMAKAELVDVDYVLDVFGGIDKFESFHTLDRANDIFLNPEKVPEKKIRVALSEAEARDAALRLYGEEEIAKLGGLERSARDAAIISLKKAGLSTRQIVRLTGISHGTVSRARI